MDITYRGNLTRGEVVDVETVGCVVATNAGFFNTSSYAGWMGRAALCCYEAHCPAVQLRVSWQFGIGRGSRAVRRSGCACVHTTAANHAHMLSAQIA